MPSPPNQTGWQQDYIEPCCQSQPQVNIRENAPVSAKSSDTIKGLPINDCPRRPTRQAPATKELGSIDIVAGETPWIRAFCLGQRVTECQAGAGMRRERRIHDLKCMGIY